MRPTLPRPLSEPNARVLTRFVLWTVLATAVVSAPAAAQHITLKTVPIPAGEQFLLFPSKNLGMGGMHIATHDPLLDPFSNPARGGRDGRIQVVALPTFYGEANNAVGGRSLPIAVLVPGGRVFAAGAFALQQVNDPRRGFWMPPNFDTQLIRDNSSTNVYAFGSLGMRLNDDRTSIGVSAYTADLEGVDVVSLLYGNSFAIEQSGGMTEFRVGVSHDFGEERTLDAVVVNNRLDMTHDVWYVDWQWRPDWTPTSRTWNEVNEDRTVTWGAQLRYLQPLGPDTRIGAIVAGNTKAHPKIPNYNIVNIPRDPGNSAAFNIGVGLANEVGRSRFAVELIYQPARSHTWAYADTATTTPAGVIPPGGKTIDNQFRFANWNLGTGIEHEGSRHGFQLGIRLHRIRYSLDQQNFLTAVRRKTREGWMEWSPSWSYVLKLDGFDVRYSGRFTARGWPDFGWGPEPAVAVPDSPGGTDFIIGATAPVDMPDFRVTTHRFMVSVPFGR